MADVDIIGGSAAGLFAAYLLAREGKQVRLFDANDVLNAESRTLITTRRLTETLGFFPHEAVINTIDRIDLFSPRRAVSIPMEEPDLVVERSAVVRLLARQAVDAGVELRGGCRLVDLKPGDKSLTVTIRDSHRGRTEQFTTTTLIGADGMSSRVAKVATGNAHGTMPLLQAIVELPKGERSCTTRVWFEPQDTPYFYWLIPQSTSHAAVGFIAEEGKSAHAKLERFLGRIGLKAVEMQSARIPSYAHFVRDRRLRRLSRRRCGRPGQGDDRGRAGDRSPRRESGRQRDLAPRQLFSRVGGVTPGAQSPPADPEAAQSLRRRGLRSPARLVKRQDDPAFGVLSSRSGRQRHLPNSPGSAALSALRADVAAARLASLTRNTDLLQTAALTRKA